MNNNHQSIKHILSVECGSWKKTFFLDKNKYSIGRNSTNTFFCHHKVVSRNHAHLIRINYDSLINPDQSEYTFWVVDGDFLGNRSTNGIFINGKKSICKQLNPGDVIFFGGIDVKAKYDIVNLQSKTFFSISNSNYKPIFSPDLSQADNSDLSVFNDFSAENFDTLELISQGVLIVDLQTSQVVKANQKYCQMLGYSSSEIVKLKFSDLDSGESEIIDYDLSVLHSHHVRCDRPSIHKGKNNQLFHVTTQGIAINYQGKKCALLSVENNQDLQKLEDVLRYQTYHDSDTNLANQKLLEKQLAWSLGFNSLKESQIALIKIKINHWDHIINQNAIASINELLEQFISQVKNSLSSLDCFCRYSNDEYFILKEEIENEYQGNSFVQKILEDLKKPILINKNPIILSINCGVAIHPDNGKYIEELIKNASLALEYSYRDGENNYQFYKENIAQFFNKQSEKDSLIYDIINAQKFQIKYQQIHDINDINKQEKLSFNTCICCEINEEIELGNIDILEIVKKIDSDGDLLLWNLEEVLKDYNSWIDEDNKLDVKISIKVLLSTLIKPDVIKKINELVNPENKFPQLELEVIPDLNFLQEQYIFNDIDKINNSLSSLPLNITLFNPDFHNLISLSKKNININSLKIPANLIENIEHDSSTKSLISLLINCAKSLDIEIIFEGVNNENQKEILSSLGCEKMQGLFFSSLKLSEEVNL